MLAYRLSRVHADPRALTEDLTEQIVNEVIDLRHFLIADSLAVESRRLVEETYWELFHGRALDRGQTRERRRFDSWHIALPAAGDAEPLLALRWDRAAGDIFVTRAILCEVHEAVETAPGVIETRPTTGWIRELVGSVAVRDAGCAGRFRDELAGLVLDAIVGASRLPLTSIESPLPQFSLGLLAYGFDERIGEGDWLAPVADRTTPPLDKTRRLEAALRFSARFDVGSVAAKLLHMNPQPERWLRLLGDVFNGASLTPYTDFTTRALQLARRLSAGEPSAFADFLARLTLLLDLHLNAYDLVRFHQGGANYPDALLLDELWREWLRLLDEAPAVFDLGAAGATRRRAVRHLLLRRIEYAGRRVPAAPNSSGDRLRVLPGSGGASAPAGDRVLFTDPVPDRSDLWQLCRDLADPRESHWLGRALFIDRPFGIGKLPGEPDRTPLLSHLLCSRNVAVRRLSLLEPLADRIGGTDLLQTARGELQRFMIAGVPAPRLRHTRPGAASLADAVISADDWLVLKTTRSSLQVLDAAFDWSHSPWLPSRDWRILLPADVSPAPSLVAYDSQVKPIARCACDARGEFRIRGGLEVPIGGLSVRSLRSDEAPIAVPPSFD